MKVERFRWTHMHDDDVMRLLRGFDRVVYHCRTVDDLDRVEFKACPRCGVEPKMEDVRERSLTKPNVLSVSCPACGMSNSVAWGSMGQAPFKHAVAMLADSWNSR